MANIPWARWFKRGPRALRPAALELHVGVALTLYAADGPLRIRVARGVAWLTGDGLPGDVILRPQAQCVIPARGRVVVEALIAARLEWSPATREDCR